MSASLKTTSAGITKRLDSMMSRSQALEGFINRVIYPLYQNYQRRRWMDQNAKQTGQWDALNPSYAARKKIMYGGGPKHEWVGGRTPWRVKGQWPSYPGQGTKMMIATGRLFKGVIGESGEHKKIVTTKSLRIFTTVPYASYADEARDFSTFDRAFKRDILRQTMQYIRGMR